MLLQVRDLTICYDTAVVLRGVNLEVDTGELIGIVGPNGAGKTTLLRAVAGLVKWEKETLRGTRLGRITFSGSIVFDGERIENLPAFKIVKRGLILCPERGRPFREMTVMDNLIAGAYLCKDKKEIGIKLAQVFELFPRLKERENQVSGTLSGGERSMLAVGRALMYFPKLLLIDEPSVGLAPLIREELFERIQKVYQSGVTILLVEQDVSFAFALAGRNYVISRGNVVTQGTGQELLRDDTIRKTYLGL